MPCPFDIVGAIEGNPLYDILTLSIRVPDLVIVQEISNKVVPMGTRLPLVPSVCIGDVTGSLMITCSDGSVNTTFDLRFCLFVSVTRYADLHEFVNVGNFRSEHTALTCKLCEENGMGSDIVL
jgi:hypothetical protein